MRTNVPVFHPAASVIQMYPSFSSCKEPGIITKADTCVTGLNCSKIRHSNNKNNDLESEEGRGGKQTCKREHRQAGRQGKALDMPQQWQQHSLDVFLESQAAKRMPQTHDCRRGETRRQKSYPPRTHSGDNNPHITSCLEAQLVTLGALISIC